MVTLNFNKKCVEKKRKYLRNNATTAERTLWQSIKGKQLGVKFRRQYSVDFYILDFYCPEMKRAIEIDGDSHFTQLGKEYDLKRKEYINIFGIKFIRFTNVDVLENIDGVLELLLQKVNNMKSWTTPGPSL
jgi:very-short-patch-repair endonuclease